MSTCPRYTDSTSSSETSITSMPKKNPDYPTYPKDPAFRKKYGPRGVLKCKAIDKDDPTVDEQFGKVGKQTIENTGPLPKERMETVDEEFLA